MKRTYSISFVRFLYLFLTIAILTFQVKAQQLTFPEDSQYASVTQRIGITDITITYHRPGVKNRVIWGKLVPYNEVWRAGANENTTISFSSPVKINGNSLDAGTYGLHMIPTEKKWIIIFSKTSWAWGSFSYDQKEDALRVMVNPQNNNFTEWLTYNFQNAEPTSTDVAMTWEKVKIPFKIEVNVRNVVVENIRKELRGIARFTWQGWQQAANYCVKNDFNLEEANKWIKRSIAMNENFTNLMTESELLSNKGNSSEAEKYKNKALELGTEAELNAYGYQFLFAKNYDKAIEIFQMNIKKYPDSWNVYDSIGEAYVVKGDNNLAVENYTKAFKMVKDQKNKDRISNILKNLSSD